MTRKQSPLGSAEKATLAALLALGGTWNRESPRWVWESTFWTVRVLDALLVKGYVHDPAPGEQYELTDSGLTAAHDLPRVVVTAPGVRAVAVRSAKRYRPATDT